ncbi:MAG: glycosyltransferase, partial [Variovorax sp.]|nr:glycosyltransferase [Variovorax sp.]
MNKFVQNGQNGLCLAFDGSDADFAKLVEFLSMDQPHQQSMRSASVAFADAYDWPRIAKRFVSAYSEVLSTT